jgi:quercetin dioxygenase-like cupin family protein
MRPFMKQKGITFNLAGAVDYHEGAVVSKIVSSSEGGNVTLFAFDEGQGLSEHTAPFDALVVVLDGEAEVAIDGKKSTLRKGEAVIMPASRPHALKALKRFKMMLVMTKA